MNLWTEYYFLIMVKELLVTANSGEVPLDVILTIAVHGF